MFNLEDNQYNSIIKEAYLFNKNVDDLECLLHEICHYEFVYDKLPDRIDSDFSGKKIADGISNKIESIKEGDMHEAECCIVTAFALKELGYEKWKEIPELAFDSIFHLNKEFIQDFIDTEMYKKRYSEKAKELIKCINNLQGIK